MTDAAPVGEIVDRHNALRAEAGLPPLMYNPMLALAASNWALHMAETRTCVHGDFDGRIRSFGYDGITVGENIGLGQKTLDEVLKDWMNSPGHRAAILSTTYQEIGAAGVDLDGVRAWATCFGQPKPRPKGII